MDQQKIFPLEKSASPILKEKKVGICYSILAIRQINTGDSSFKADLGIFMDWTNSSIINDERSDNEIIKDVRTPEIKIINATSEDIYRRNVRIINKAIGEVNNFEGRRLEIHNNYNLKKFPFDSQDLLIIAKSNWRLESSNYTPEYNKNKRYETYFMKECDKNAGWKFILSKSSHYFLKMDRFNYYVVNLHYERQSLFFIISVFLPIFILIVLGFSSYAINYQDYGNRLNVALVVLLTLAAFRFTLSDSLPKLGYLTVFDKYNLSGLLFILFECLFNFCLSLAAGDNEYLQNVDLGFHIVITGCWTAWTFGYCAFHILFKSKKDPLNNIAESIDDEQIHLNQVNFIDKENLTLIKNKNKLKNRKKN